MPVAIDPSTDRTTVTCARCADGQQGGDRNEPDLFGRGDIVFCRADPTTATRSTTVGCPRGSPTIVSGLLIASGTALAVHNTGVFQMDGDAQTALDSTPTALEDWDLICKANPDTCTFKPGYAVPAGTTTVTVSSHEADGVGQSNFTTGGSKDPQDVPNWRRKDGSVPDKDDLQAAFAARYSLRRARPARCHRADLRAAVLRLGPLRQQRRRHSRRSGSSRTRSGPTPTARSAASTRTATC